MNYFNDLTLFSIIEYGLFYVIIGVFFVLLNSFVYGYNMREVPAKIYVGIISWPVDLCILLGITTRVLISKISKKNKSKK